MQEFIVSTLEDENDGNHDAGDLSLREAIALANEQEGADTITFDSNLSGGTIILNSGELLIDKSLNIQGLGSENLTIDAEGRSRVFNIDDGNTETQSNVSLKGLTIKGGSAPDVDGGSIANQENLTLSDSNVTENSSNGIVNLNASITINNSHINDNGKAGLRNENSEITINNSFVDNNRGDGGIVSRDSELNIFNSSVSNNSGYGNGGINSTDVFKEGSSITNIENSVISNNFSGPSSSAGAIYASTINIKNSTVSNNYGNPGDQRLSAIAGGIVANTANISNSTISGNDGVGYGVSASEGTITSSIIAGNVSDDGKNTKDLRGEITSGGNNLIGDRGNVEAFVDGENEDLVGTSESPIDPQLGELQDNGGATPTQELLADSPAIDAGSNPNSLATDQRGEGFDRTVGDGTDIGAFEVQDGEDNGGGGSIPDELVVSTLEDENDGDFGAGDLSLREAIALANQQEGEDSITFDASLSGGTIAFAESQERNLTINDSVSINGLGQDNLTLDGGFIFNIANAETDVAIDGLNLTGSKIDSFGNLTLTNSTLSQTLDIAGFSDNSAIISRGTTSISDSTIKDNSGGR
ncbi:MAG: hypothetical protein RLZZ04_4249 [Cyanobacteriota bacterium]|jgi:CSLREA domain-containing protein